MWFGYYPEIIFCHFFCNLNLVIFKCTIMAGDINSLNLLVFDEYWYFPAKYVILIFIRDFERVFFPKNNNNNKNINISLKTDFFKLISH